MNAINTNNLPKGSKVLVQLSGGKDSIACMILLKKSHISFEAIHFTHKYGYELPTQMAKKTCNVLNVKLHVHDISGDIESILLNNFRDRPCRECKGIMDRISVDFAKNNGFSYICIGDTLDDKMLLNRIVALEGDVNPISHYLNQKVVLPDNLSIYRPLIQCSGEYTLALVLSSFPDFKRVNDTGDKYFEYSREGCPLQFKDIGASYSIEMMYDLKKLNDLCSEYASKRGIRASIHLPSEFVVTIPRGYENECRQYLEQHGVTLSPPVCSKPSMFRYLIDIKPNSSMKEVETIKIACNRLAERLCINGIINFNGSNGWLNCENVSIGVMCDNSNGIIIAVTSKEPIWNTDYIENVCLEIFRTNRFKVLSYII